MPTSVPVLDPQQFSRRWSNVFLAEDESVFHFKAERSLDFTKIIAALHKGMYMLFTRRGPGCRCPESGDPARGLDVESVAGVPGSDLSLSFAELHKGIKFFSFI